MTQVPAANPDPAPPDFTLRFDFGPIGGCFELELEEPANVVDYRQGHDRVASMSGNATLAAVVDWFGAAVGSSVGASDLPPGVGGLALRPARIFWRPAEDAYHVEVEFGTGRGKDFVARWDLETTVIKNVRLRVRNVELHEEARIS